MEVLAQDLFSTSIVAPLKIPLTWVRIQESIPLGQVRLIWWWMHCLVLNELQLAVISGTHWWHVIEKTANKSQGKKGLHAFEAPFAIEKTLNFSGLCSRKLSAGLTNQAREVTERCRSVNVDYSRTHKGVTRWKPWGAGAPHPPPTPALFKVITDNWKSKWRKSFPKLNISYADLSRSARWHTKKNWNSSINQLMQSAQKFVTRAP